MFPVHDSSRIDCKGTRPVPVRLLGDPALRERCAPVEDFGSPRLFNECRQLAATLEEFRRVNGFGRAIAAPQIGIPRRILAMNLGDGPFILLNPLITARSDDTFTLWDDCMSFPWLLVRVRRHASISIEYDDLTGTHHSVPGLDHAVSELLQHEIDHLDGILALDRALDTGAVISRLVYEADRKRFDSKVEYTIAPTI